MGQHRSSPPPLRCAPSPPDQLDLAPGGPERVHWSGAFVDGPAAGRTNREIANELFVTVKAVEWHLGNAHRKLDIRGRGDLADKL